MTPVLIRSTKCIATDESMSIPDMIAVRVQPDLMLKAEKCLAFMRENQVCSMSMWDECEIDFYAIAEPGDVTVIESDGIKYVTYKPEYGIDGTSIKIFRDGSIYVAPMFKRAASEFEFELTDIASLRREFGHAERQPITERNI